MENYNQDIAPIAVTRFTKQRLSASTGWAKFIAIMAFIFIGIIVLAALTAGVQALPMLSRIFESGSGTQIGIGVAVALIGALLFYVFILALNLLKFANQMKKATNKQDQEAFLKGWVSLRIYFRLLGIGLIISTAFLLLTTVFQVMLQS